MKNGLDPPAAGWPIGGGGKRQYEAAESCYLIGYYARMLPDNKNGEKKSV